MLYYVNVAISRIIISGEMLNILMNIDGAEILSEYIYSYTTHKNIALRIVDFINKPTFTGEYIEATI